jgi:Metal-dependent hydrolases of the beta-lactamase superfamily I
MQVTFLGTGTSQGIPVIGCHCDVCSSLHSEDKRLRAAAFIEYRGLRLLIDAGPDFRQQLLRKHIDQVDAILLTHQHKDHTAGLDDVRAFNHITGRPIDIYAEPMVQAALIPYIPHPSHPRFSMELIKPQMPQKQNASQHTKG